MHIRPASVADALDIAKYIVMAEGDNITLLFRDEAETVARDILVPLILSTEVNRFSLENVLVAEWDGAPAGAVLAFPADRQDELDKPVLAVLRRRGRDFERLYPEGEKGTYYLCSMGVDPDYRGMGIGTTLMAEAERKGQSMGLDRSSLLVAKDKPKVRGLYSRLGYVVSGEANIAGLEYWRMIKNLPTVKETFRSPHFPE